MSSVLTRLRLQTRMRFHCRLMGFIQTASTPAQWISGISTSSSSWTAATGAPNPYMGLPAGIWTTVTFEWFATVPAGTSNYYVMYNLQAGSGTFYVANEVGTPHQLFYAVEA
eukprot:TRINITY_DN416_c0_g2_i2.p2 TRINITY_DN416_c0_g2~~TRINITY_DN416_c0_g2_i2.p2  ORF type:complete len:131 (+),score=25.35 TRINITY_DN416_c0_g2_i2:58-393(+)